MTPARALVVFAFLAACIGAQTEPSTTERPRSKKGLQVQMVSDAIELGIAHACLNVQLGHLVRRERGRDDDIALPSGTFVSVDALRSLDRQVAPLTRHGVELNFILLARVTGDATIDALQLDPRFDDTCPNKLGAFRVLDAPGQEHFGAVIEVLAQRYDSASTIGTVRGWIVGNEVNSHWYWHNLGEASVDDVARVYEPAVRLVHEISRRHNDDARTYISLEHHWHSRYMGGNARRSCAGRALLDRFAALARERGDFPWHVAYHPYPEDLFDCRFWEDETALPTADTPRITFKNLEVLTDYLARAELTFDGRPRRVILSEQGFHCKAGEQGERDQVEAFRRAWAKVQALDGIDAFIYHRHVDHAMEGGLRFGLWTTARRTLSSPGSKRPLWEVFRTIDRGEK